MRRRYWSLLLLAAMVSQAQAQMSANPPSVAYGVRAFGDRLGPDVVKGVTELYKPLHEAASREGVSVTTNIPYGSDECQKLDLHVPSNLPAGAKVPILVFAHGGGFVGRLVDDRALRCGLAQGRIDEGSTVTLVAVTADGRRVARFPASGQRAPSSS